MYVLPVRVSSHQLANNSNNIKCVRNDCKKRTLAGYTKQYKWQRSFDTSITWVMCAQSVENVMCVFACFNNWNPNDFSSRTFDGWYRYDHLVLSLHLMQQLHSSMHICRSVSCWYVAVFVLVWVCVSCVHFIDINGLAGQENVSIFNHILASIMMRWSWFPSRWKVWQHLIPHNFELYSNIIKK